MTDTFLAWCGGFFDGEGSLDIYRRRRRGTCVYLLRANITQKDPLPLRIVRDNFGGHLAEPGRGSSCWKWVAATRVAEAFLRAIHPYTIVKAPQIYVALSFMDRRVPVGKGRARSHARAVAYNRLRDPIDSAEIRDLKRVDLEDYYLDRHQPHLEAHYFERLTAGATA